MRPRLSQSWVLPIGEPTASENEGPAWPGRLSRHTGSVARTHPQWAARPPKGRILWETSLRGEDGPGAAAGGADHPPPAPHTPPRQPTHLYSPTTVLKYQRGNCFDFSTLLCSMLIGSGYDAYVVNGYGSQDLCLMDLTREVCPLTMKPKTVGRAPGAPR